MGVVKDKYLKCEYDGDQYVGGCESGFDQLEKIFSASPLYFDFSSIEDKVKKSVKIKDKILDGCQANTNTGV